MGGQAVRGRRNVSAVARGELVRDAFPEVRLIPEVLAVSMCEGVVSCSSLNLECNTPPPCEEEEEVIDVVRGCCDRVRVLRRGVAVLLISLAKRCTDQRTSL